MNFYRNKRPPNSWILYLRANKGRGLTYEQHVVNWKAIKPPPQGRLTEEEIQKIINDHK